MSITKESVDGLMETVCNLYLADDIPWVIGYSGGKDSTATLQLVMLSLLKIPVEKRKKTVYAIMDSLSKSLKFSKIFRIRERRKCESIS